MSNIEDFIHAVDSGSNVEAKDIFNNMMQDKLSAALDSKRAEIADKVYNKAVEVDEPEQMEIEEPEEEFADVDVQGTEEELD